MTNEIKIGEITFVPDTHCDDADTGLDVWSFSPGLVREMLAESDKKACGAYGIAGFKPWEATHLKTGNVYQVIGEAVDATNAASNRAMVIYRGNGQTFVRCADEFVEKFEDRGASVERKRMLEIRTQRDELLAALKAILASDRTRIGINEYNAAKAAIASAEQPTTSPAPDDDDWIEWNGGKCPVPGDTVVQVKLRDNLKGTNHACRYRWTRIGNYDDIIAYRVVKGGA